MKELRDHFVNRETIGLFPEFATALPLCHCLAGHQALKKSALKIFCCTF